MSLPDRCPCCSSLALMGGTISSGAKGVESHISCHDCGAALRVPAGRERAGKLWGAMLAVQSSAEDLSTAQALDSVLAHFQSAMAKAADRFAQIRDRISGDRIFEARRRISADGEEMARAWALFSEAEQLVHLIEEKPSPSKQREALCGWARYAMRSIIDRCEESSEDDRVRSFALRSMLSDLALMGLDPAALGVGLVP